MKRLMYIVSIIFVMLGCTPTTSSVVIANDVNRAPVAFSGEQNQAVCKAKVAPGPRKVGNPYSIDGQMYYPVSTAEGYEEVGVASWYGPGFHGKLTANGEIYDQTAMTAAHRTLPIPTYVVVENIENGKTVVVRVNDRGPFSKGRIIDLSEKAASQIGMIEKGTAQVRVSVLSEDPNCVVVKGQEIDIDKGNFAIQIGAFSNPDNAERLMNRFGDKGHVSVGDINGNFWYRVWVTGYTSRNDAEVAASQLSSEFPGAFIIAR